MSGVISPPKTTQGKKVAHAKAKVKMSSGMVITFYSYKGGVGRSFILANVSVLLSKWGYRVLCIDWDLEAPGLSHYFAPWNNNPKHH
ncbi:AAA family ATPase [Candidatus Magnetobacterium casense]|uniref:nucleotide-binding protein n=1 Tax=Candidatus Magnetobacterium casense TaxID=1455061 RepID=UPI00058E2745|nr:AAA family ATPase [Candidatus Magnetobacterium casensis]